MTRFSVHALRMLPRKWIWIGTGIIGLAASILVVFLVFAKKADEKTDLTADIQEIEQLLSKGKSSAGYCTMHAPKRLAVWRQAAEAGSAEGQFLLASCYAVGAGVLTDPEQMVAWLRKSADQGFPMAQFYLAVSHYSGAGVAKDQAEAVRWLRKAADGGDSRAQFSLGYCYLGGVGVVKDLAEGVRWLRKAAHQGDALAQSELAAMHGSGHAVAKDKAEAFRYSRMAADQELDIAQLQLGIAHATGDGAPMDAAQAARWFQKAADQGNTFAETCLASCYAAGDGVSQNWMKAVERYERAAKGGNPVAMNNLGHCYENGQGVPKDLAKAAAWYLKGSKMGDPAAMYNVALCFAAGKGVDKDVTQACAWLEKSAKADYEPAKQQIMGGDLLSKGSVWRGTGLYDRDPTGEASTWEIVVTERNGEKFKADMTKVGHKPSPWRSIEGTITKDGAISWHGVPGQPNEGVPHQGKLNGKSIETRFKNDKDDCNGTGGGFEWNMAPGTNSGVAYGIDGYQPSQATTHEQVINRIAAAAALGLGFYALAHFNPVITGSHAPLASPDRRSYADIRADEYEWNLYHPGREMPLGWRNPWR